MVTYAHRTHKATIQGTMYNGNEMWTTSFWIGNDSGGDQPAAPTVAEAQAIATAWQTFFTTGSSKVSSSFQSTGVKVSLVASDGKSDPGQTAFYNYPAAVNGGNVGTQPPQVALVCTLTSAVGRGHGSKGRMFLPGIMAGLDNTGHLNGIDTGAISDNLKTFYDAVNANADVPGSIVLNAAEVAGVPFRAARMEKVTGIRLGNVYDTQRRRRNQLAEVYTAKVLA